MKIFLSQILSVLKIVVISESRIIGFVFKNYGINVPRSAAEQKLYATKLKDKEAAKGDLVFFKSGKKLLMLVLLFLMQVNP